MTHAVMIDAARPRAGEIERDEALVFPMAKSAIAELSGNGSELRLFYRDTEISFETREQVAFGLGLAKHPRFVADQALGWSDLDWNQVSAMLRELLEAGILQRETEAGEAVALERVDRASPLPPAPARAARSFAEPALLPELVGRDIEPGYLEVVVPIFRVAHSALDRDGRQIGEANVFPKALRLDVATQWRTCTYSGSRYQPQRPINVSALKAMRVHWRQMMALLSRVRESYLARLPDARAGWTVGDIERVATAVLALPSYLLLRSDQAVGNGALHPALSNLFRVADGLRMVMHQMLFVPTGEGVWAPETRVTGAEILAYAERNHSFYSEHGVCAGPQFMIAEFLAVLLDGAEPKSFWPDRLDPEVAAAAEAVEAGLDYALLGLETHAASFALWPAMARAFGEIDAALEGGGAGGIWRERFRAHRSRMEAHSYLGSEDRRRKRELVYDDMRSSCALAMGLGRPEALSHLARQAIATFRGDDRNLFDAALAAQLGPAAPGVRDVLERFFAAGQALLRAAEASQARLNALLGRPQTRRPLSLADLNQHNVLIGDEARSLPFLLDELSDLLALSIDVRSDAILIERRPLNSGATRNPGSQRARKHVLEGEVA